MKGHIAVLSPLAAANGFIRHWSPSNTWFLGPTWVNPSNGVSISSVIFVGLMNVINTCWNACDQQTQRQTHRQTHRQTDPSTPICRNSSHLMQCMLCGVIINNHVPFALLYLVPETGFRKSSVPFMPKIVYKWSVPFHCNGFYSIFVAVFLSCRVLQNNTCLHFITLFLVGLQSIVIGVSVCLSVCHFVCLFAYIRNHTSEFSQIFCTCCLWLW